MGLTRQAGRQMAIVEAGRPLVCPECADSALPDAVHPAQNRHRWNLLVGSAAHELVERGEFVLPVHQP
jgi:hypothetical protein